MNRTLELAIEVVLAMTVFSLIIVFVSDSLNACTDSDNGNNSFAQGTTTASQQSRTDYCNIDGRLVEYYCGEDKKPNQNIVDCANGCNNGACAKSETPNCMITTTNQTVAAGGSISWELAYSGFQNAPTAAQSNIDCGNGAAIMDPATDFSCQNNKCTIKCSNYNDNAVFSVVLSNGTQQAICGNRTITVS